MSILESALDFLACPNDGNSLSQSSDSLLCSSCGQKFKILTENILELLPQKQFTPTIHDETTKSYDKYYTELKEMGHSSDPDKRLWGLKSKSLPAGFVRKLRDSITSAIGQEIVCDVGAGSGDYSLVLAKKSRLVFHCDLDLEAIIAASQEAKRLNLNNIVFVRCNYFSLPFADGCLPSITCIDVLLRGEEHDNKLLDQISIKLRHNGIAVLDFHSKERASVNKNLDLGGCYSNAEIKSLLARFNLSLSVIKGFGHAPTLPNMSDFSYALVDKIGKVIFPPARWLTVNYKK